MRELPKPGSRACIAKRGAREVKQPGWIAGSRDPIRRDRPNRREAGDLAVGSADAGIVCAGNRWSCDGIVRAPLRRRGLRHS
eukprot:15484066-Alexandrium_andersonii.AAC.1